jgi:hypothetical protein
VVARFFHKVIVEARFKPMNLGSLVSCSTNEALPSTRWQYQSKV